MEHDLNDFWHTIEVYNFDPYSVGYCYTYSCAAYDCVRMWCQRHLVEHVSLAAQVQVWQDPGRPAAADGDTGLRDAGRHRRGLPFTQTREQVRERHEPTCGAGQNTLRSLKLVFMRPDEDLLKETCF